MVVNKIILININETNHKRIPEEITFNYYLTFYVNNYFLSFLFFLISLNKKKNNFLIKFSLLKLNIFYFK